MPTKKLALLGVWHVHARHHLDWSRSKPGSEIDVVWERDAEAGGRFATAHGLRFDPTATRCGTGGSGRRMVVDRD